MEARGFEGIYCCPERENAFSRGLQPLNQLAEQEWTELPYAMMRITAARVRGAKRFYWRDRCVECDDIELNLIRSRSADGAFLYTAAYSVEDDSRKGRRRDLLVPLEPSLEGQQVRWSAPGLSDMAEFTTRELAKALVDRLIAFA